MFRIARAYMMTTAGYSGIIEAANSWKDTDNMSTMPEERAKIILENSVIAAVSGPANITKELIKTVTNKK